jgi:oligopeptidase B
VDRWKAVIAQSDVLLESYALFRDWLVLEERSQGLTRLRQVNWQSGEQKEIAFDDPAYVTWLAYNPEPDTSALRYGYSSMTTPSSTYELDMDSGKRTLLKQQPVAGFVPAQYASERLWITARDGVAVPVSLVYRKDKFKKAGVVQAPIPCWSTAMAPTAPAWTGLQQLTPEPAGPGLRLRHRPYPGWRGAGPHLV